MRCPIIQYLMNSLAKTKRKVKFKAINYVLIGNKLYKNQPDRLMLSALVTKNPC